VCVGGGWCLSWNGAKFRILYYKHFLGGVVFRKIAGFE
jgi:hypothetical protein